MNIVSIKTEEAAKQMSEQMRPDFRFGAINLISFIAIMSIGAMVQLRIGTPEVGDITLRPDIFAIIATIIMGGIMALAPRWQTVIGLGVVYWALLRFIWGGMEIWPLHFAAPIGLLFSASIEVAKQWEKAVVLRLGKFQSLKGPGFFTIVPLIDRADAYIDQRVRVTDFAAETTLTKDTVPVSVDAIAFWMVWDAKMSILEVADFNLAVTLAAQTALRDAIGKHDLGEMLTHRDRIGSEIQAVLDTKTTPWGITIQSIEIRDVVIPKELEDAMSRQAQAERERQSRVILGTAETEIAEKFAEASESYRNNPVALHLRAMNMVFEGLKNKGSMVIVPSSAVETMGLGALGGLASLGNLGNQGGAAEEAAETIPDPIPAPAPKVDPGKK